MRNSAIQTTRGWGRRCAVFTAGALALAASLRPDAASAEPISFAGSVSVTVPRTVEYVQFSMTVMGSQTYDSATVDNTLGGTLTLAWAGSQEEPRPSVRSCPGGGAGSWIVLEGATPSTSLLATWASPTSQERIGPAEVPSRGGLAGAGACVEHADDGEPGGDPEPGSGGGDPDPGSQVTPPRPEEYEDDEDDDDDDDSDQSESDGSGIGSGSGHGSDGGSDDD